MGNNNVADGYSVMILCFLILELHLTLIL